MMQGQLTIVEYGDGTLTDEEGQLFFPFMRNFIKSIKTVKWDKYLKKESRKRHKFGSEKEK